MKKSELKKLIRESIQEILVEIDIKVGDMIGNTVEGFDHKVLKITGDLIDVKNIVSGKKFQLNNVGGSMYLRGQGKHFEQPRRDMRYESIHEDYMYTKDLKPGMFVIHKDWDERTAEPMEVVSKGHKILLKLDDLELTEPTAGGESDYGWYEA